MRDGCLETQNTLQKMPWRGKIMDAHEMSSSRNGRRGRSGLSAKNVPYLIIFPSVPRLNDAPF